jgi:ribosomal protein L11 methyltransferase
VKWVEFSIQTPSEFVEPLSQIFHRYGQGGVAVEGAGGFNPDEGEVPPEGALGTLRTYVPLDERLDGRRAQIQVGVLLVGHVAPISELRERVLDEQDWQEAWKQHFHALPVGRRTVVVPTWREYQASDSQVVVRLDPGMAFGTGHHPTTRMCLEELESLVQPGMAVLDVGCGSGILSIAAAKLGATRVIGIEIEPTAANVAAENVRLNGVEKVVEVHQGSLPYPAVAPASYGLVCANISAKVVCDLADEFAAASQPGAAILVSGVLKERLEEVSRRLSDAGFGLERTRVDGDWVALVARAIG